MKALPHPPSIPISGVAALCLAATIAAILVIRHGTAASPVIAAVPVGMYPSAVAIDGKARRALVLNSYDTTVSVLDEETGTPVVTVTVGSNGGAHPQRIAVDTRTAHAFVLTDDGLATMLDARSGRVLSRVLVGGSSSAIAVDDEQARAFVTDGDAGTVAVIGTRTGALVRTVRVGQYPEEIACDMDTRRVFVANQGDNTVSMLDARTGRLVRTVHLKDSPDDLAISDRYHEALITGVAGSVAGVDASTGATIFQRALFHGAGAPHAALIAPDDPRGIVLIARDARIDELDPRSGRTVGMIGLPGEITALAADPTTGAVIAAVRGKVDAPGRVLIVDTRGRLISTIPVGVDPSALAIDPSNGRMLVAVTNLNPDGSPARPLPTPHNALTDLGLWLRRWLPHPRPSPVAQAHDTAGAVYVLRLGAS